MDTSQEQQIKSLTRKLKRCRQDASLGTFGFLIGAMGIGFLLQWYVRSIHGNADAMLPMIGFGCAFGGILYAALLIAISRLRDYFLWKRTETTRMQDYLSAPKN
ncbi:MAG: hypothetical protein ABI304_00820 [Rudaea sp.]